MEDLNFPEETDATHVPSGGPRRRGKFLVGASVLAIVVAGVAIGVSTSSPSANAAAIVRAALVSSVGDKTVSFTMDEQISGAANVDVSGSGACDFSSDDCNMTIGLGGQDAALGQVTAIYAGGTAYMSFSGTAASQLPTPWVSLSLNGSSLAQSGSLGTTQNPLSAIAELAKLGGQVTDDGTVNVGDSSMHEYTVALSSSAIESQMSSEMAKMPSWMSKVSSSSAIKGESFDVYINDAGQLGKIAVTTSVSAGGKDAQVTLDEVMTGYGNPVTVNIPPANEVTPLSSLLNSLG